MKILWTSNAPWTSSGYGQQTALTVPRIAAEGHDVAVNCFFGLEGAAINWNGINCYPTDRTRFGIEMLPEYAAHHAGSREKCHVLTLMDVWVMMQGVPGFSGLKFTCWTPIDHDPAPPMVVEFLRRVNARTIAMTRFGESRLQAAGFDPMYAPHGVDTKIFKPNPEQAAETRERMKIPSDAFVVGMVAANQGIPSRKSFPQVFDAFSVFHRKHPNSILYLHTDIAGRIGGIDLNALSQMCGIPPEAMRATEYTPLHVGLSQQDVASVYGIFDVLAMPSMGEGFGIPLIEAQACGVPVITTNWTAMSELCGAGWLVEGDRFYDGTQRSFQKLPAVSEIVKGLESAYEARGDAALRDKAVAFAQDYEVDAVFDKYWRPILDQMERPREVAPLELAAA